MLLTALPGTNICAAVNILILPLSLKLVSSKLPLVHCPIWHSHDALALPLTSSVATGIAATLSNQVQPNSLPPVIAVLPKVGVSIAVYCFGPIILPLVGAVKST